MFKKIFSNELFRGSFILLFLTNLGNLFSYLFQFLMARLLGPADYGILAVITNIVAIFTIPSLSIQTLVAKTTTKLNVNKNYEEMSGLFKGMLKKFVKVSFYCFIIFCLFSGIISNYLNISIWILILSGTFLFGAFLYPIGTGILQGRKKFTELGFIFMSNTFLKLVIGVGLVTIGFGVYGAVMGFVLGTLIAFILILPSIKDILKIKTKKKSQVKFSRDDKYTLVSMILLVLIYSIDVFFAKGFFSAEVAGKYAVISMIGKIILFINIAIGNVMLPINSEKFQLGHKTNNVTKKTFLLVSLICLISLSVFLFFPDMVIKILFGGEYASLSIILIYVGVGFSFISLLNILILVIISRDSLKTKHILLLLCFLILQIIALTIYHKTIEEFSLAFMFSNIITFIGVLFFSK